MAFFKKLKERLFKSSSKIDEGLEAIISDGGQEMQLHDNAPDVMLAQTATAERESAKATGNALDRSSLEREIQDREEEVREADAKREAEAKSAQAAQAARDAEQQKAKVATERAEAELVEAARVLQAAAEEAQRDAEIKAEANDAHAKAEKLALEAAEIAKREAEKLEAEQAVIREAKANADREAAEQAAEQAARAADEQQRQQAMAAERAARDAEAKVTKEQDAAAEEPPVVTAQLRTTLTPVAPDLVDDTSETSEPPQKPSLLGRLMGRTVPSKTVVRRVLDDDMLEQLEELLIAADMGVETALRVTANMAEGRFGKKLSVAEIKYLMAAEIARIMEPVAQPLPIYSKTPQVVLVVGVNGSGKTTTIGKLASQFRAAGKNVVIAAGDTFRAAAVEQLQVWGDRAGVPVLTAPQGSDPASLAFDAMTKAEKDGADLLMIDTAGRLQNRGDLMEELAKIVRVIRKKDPTAPHNTLLVLDATTGQNALNQVKVFQEISDVSGLVMTKLDGTAKGGVLVALADKFGLPIHAIGVGEQIDDLDAFDPQEFADALVGLDR